MKRTLLAALAIATATAALPATASATDTPPVDTDCFQPFDVGPSRAAHSAPATVRNTYEGRNCGDIVGICVTVDYSNPNLGPARATHNRRELPAPCVPLGEACAITVNYYDYANAGPARPTHQVSMPTRPRGLSGGVVDIPPACESLLVLAQTPTGSETAPLLWIATALLGAGAILIIAPRRLARR